MTAQRHVRVDVAFTNRRLAVFIDGCFWHCCPQHGTSPLENRQYWAPKLERNRERDLEVADALTAAGWAVLRLWEHEGAEDAVARVVALLQVAR